MKNKRRNGAQPEMKSLFKGYGDFPIKRSGIWDEMPLLPFLTAKGIACYNECDL